jgi:2-polyprenyl-3-methyl-5-hydroxy-6-metoxy-1,4-benzoquinol methylase
MLTPVNDIADTDRSRGRSSDRISAIALPACTLCGRQGKLLYAGLTDWLYEVPEIWGIRRCSVCDLAWLDPQPSPKDIPRLYSRYCTHVSKHSMSRIGRLQHAISECALERLGYPSRSPNGIVPRLFSRLPSAKRTALMSVLGLAAPGAGSLLDVGCGNGEFISRMRTFGWKVSGIDPDPQAVSCGRSNGLDIHSGTIADLPESACYDVITLTHVIEHVADPVNLLHECGKRLRPHTGRLILTTPNINSFGHAWFRKYWRGLEVPRHLMLFSAAALHVCAARAGMKVQSTTTETRLAQMIYLQSASAKVGHRNVGDTVNFRKRTKFAARVFRMIENSMRLVSKDLGEEIFCVCTKPGNGSDSENRK